MRAMDRIGRGVVAAVCVLGCLAGGRDAAAQPAAEDLGELSGGRITRPYVALAPGQVRWVRFTVPEIGEHAFLDVGVNSRSSNGSVALYNSTGQRVAMDTTTVASMHLTPALSFGAPITARAGSWYEPPFNGRDGLLPAGEYYLAIGATGATFGETDWAVSDPRGGIHGFMIELGTPVPPLDLGVLGDTDFTISTIEVLPRQVRWVTFIVPEASNTAGRYIDIAAIPHSAYGWSGAAIYDDQGRLVARSNEFTSGSRLGALSLGAFSPARMWSPYLAFDGKHGDLPAGRYYVALGERPLDFGTTNWDVCGWTSTTGPTLHSLRISIGSGDPTPPDAWIEMGPAGSMIGTAATPIGSGPLTSIVGRVSGRSADVYQIEITDPAAFGVTTEGGPNYNTALYLFNPDGTGVVMNDSTVGSTPVSALSTITNRYITRPGTYYLAVSPLLPVKDNGGFNELIWARHAALKERQPDGPRPDAVLGGWWGTAYSDAGYIIRLTGVAYPCTQRPVCIADFDESGGVDGEDVAAFLRRWGNGDTCADVDSSGGLDGDDWSVFILAWQAGC